MLSSRRIRLTTPRSGTPTSGLLVFLGERFENVAERLQHAEDQEEDVLHVSPCGSELIIDRTGGRRCGDLSDDEAVQVPSFLA
jgi:hypothetical protein